MQKIFFTAFLTLLLANLCFAQFNNPWRGKKATVVITYDDAIDQQLDNAVPLLDSLGLKSTFYITGYSVSMQQRLNDWKNLAVRGHELGNHTMYHPCTGGTGREWVKPEFDLANYTIPRIVNEIKATNLLLQSMDGKINRTFAFTCGDTKVNDSSFASLIKNDFVALRGVKGRLQQIGQVDLSDVSCYVVNHHTAAQMIAWVNEAVKTNSLLVILFHGVGGGNSLDVSLEDHRAFLRYLKENEKDLWVAPMVEVAQQVKDWQVRDKQQRAIQQATNEDYKNMLFQLKIDSVRRGPSGNPSAPNAANIDEAKASPYTSIPDPLVLKNGKKVTNADTWWKKRRPEIIEEFDREIYGRLPKNLPKVNWEIISATDTVIGGIRAVTKNLLGHADNSLYPQLKADIQLSLTTPKRNEPVPVMMEFGFIFPPGFNPPPPPGTLVKKSWQQQLLEKGWGFAIIVPTSYQADNGAGLTQGIIGLVNKGQPRKPDDWGTLRAWAWGASRALDYFETDKNVDAKKIGIEGLSRYGKAAIVTMAYDPRFAIGFIGSSGAGGTKILRRVFGEQVENLASSGEYHWFAGNFIKYAGPLTPNDLPADAHELVALCAPRPVFISSGSPNVEGRWVDAKGMFLGGVHAGPVYKLLGKTDLGSTEFPPEQTTLTNGDIAFRQHNEGHTTGPNWPYFIEFAGRYFSSAPVASKPLSVVKGLKEYYKKYFPIGVAVSPGALKSDEGVLIQQQFNSMTPENAMKMGPIHPAPNQYNWAGSDSIAAFARRNNIKLRGHCLVWHNQTPGWLFKDAEGKQVSKELLLQRIKEHITTVVTRYKDVIYAWDVVNEVISDKPEEFYRNTLFYQVCGEEFIAKAFQWAHEADPKAILFYNDYNEIDPVKREKIIRLIKELQVKGIPIQGAGLQAHWAINEPSEEQLEKTLSDFAALGLSLQITELDISVYPKEHTARERKSDDYDTAFSTAKEEKQMAVYKMCFDAFRRYKKNITGVTFWNISDRHSWLDDFPVRGRKDYPLLFDKELKPKKAFREVVQF
jgi:GH35 family endo-1,4-beta-xylanase